MLLQNLINKSKFILNENMMEDVIPFVLFPHSTNKNIMVGCRGLHNEKIVIHLEHMNEKYFPEFWKISINDVIGTTLNLHQFAIDDKSRKYYIQLFKNFFEFIKKEFPMIKSQIKVLIFHFPKKFKDNDLFNNKLHMMFQHTYALTFHHTSYSFKNSNWSWIYFSVSESIAGTFSKFLSHMETEYKQTFDVDNIDPLIEMIVSDQIPDECKTLNHFTIKSSDDFYPEKVIRHDTSVIPEVEFPFDPKLLEQIIKVQNELEQHPQDISDFKFINFLCDDESFNKIINTNINKIESYSLNNSNNFFNILYYTREFITLLCADSIYVSIGTSNKALIKFVEISNYLQTIPEDKWPVGSDQNKNITQESKSVLQWIKNVNPIIDKYNKQEFFKMPMIREFMIKKLDPVDLNINIDSKPKSDFFDKVKQAYKIMSKSIFKSQDISDYKYLNYTCSEINFIKKLNTTTLNYSDLIAKYNYTAIFLLLLVSDKSIEEINTQDLEFTTEQLEQLMEYSVYLNHNEPPYNDLTNLTLDILDWLKKLYNRTVIDENISINNISNLKKLFWFTDAIPSNVYVKDPEKESPKSKSKTAVEKIIELDNNYKGEDIDFLSDNINFYCDKEVFLKLLQEDTTHNKKEKTIILKVKDFFDKILKETIGNLGYNIFNPAVLSAHTEFKTETFKSLYEYVVFFNKFKSENDVFNIFSDLFFEKTSDNLPENIIIPLLEIQKGKDNYYYDVPDSLKINYLLPEKVIESQIHQYNTLYINQKYSDNIIKDILFVSKSIKVIFDELEKVNINKEKCIELVDAFLNYIKKLYTTLTKDEKKLMSLWNKANTLTRYFVEWVGNNKNELLTLDTNPNFFLIKETSNLINNPNNIVYDFFVSVPYLVYIETNPENREIKTFKFFFDAFLKYFQLDDFNKDSEVLAPDKIKEIKDNIGDFESSLSLKKKKKYNNSTENPKNLKNFIIWILDKLKTFINLNSDNLLLTIAKDITNIPLDKQSKKELTKVAFHKIISYKLNSLNPYFIFHSLPFSDKFTEEEQSKLISEAELLWSDNGVLDQIDPDELKEIEKQFIHHSVNKFSTYNKTINRLEEQSRAIFNNDNFVFAVRDYTSDSHHANSLMRSKKIHHGEVSQELIDLIKMFFNNHAAIKENITVIRGIYKNHFLENYRAGDFIIDSGFFSTTVKAEIVMNNFNISSGSHLLKVYIPKNLKGVYLEPETTIHGEREILLPPGSIFKILKIENRMQHNDFGKYNGFLYTLLYIGSATIDSADIVLKNNSRWNKFKETILKEIGNDN